MKKIILVAVILMGVLVSGAFATPKFIDGKVNHYYEFNSYENPDRNWWCGHTALKMAAEYVTGEYKSLGMIHYAMIQNSSYYANNSVCGSHFCSRLYDIEMAAQSSNPGSYNRPNTVRRSVSTKQLFLQKVKDGVINDLPPIADSRFDVSVGHFYVIVGYDEKPNIDDTIIYLMDPLEKYPRVSNWDKTTTLKNFWENMDTKQFVFVK